jgi:hypothetical protein
VTAYGRANPCGKCSEASALRRLLLRRSSATARGSDPVRSRDRRSWISRAVAEGFEPSEAFTSRAFEFCGWWFRPVRLGLVAPEPRLSSPLRTPLNLCE